MVPPGKVIHLTPGSPQGWETPTERPPDPEGLIFLNQPHQAANLGLVPKLTSHPPCPLLVLKGTRRQGRGKVGSWPRVWGSEHREAKPGVRLVSGVRLTLTDNKVTLLLGKETAPPGWERAKTSASHPGRALEQAPPPPRPALGRPLPAECRLGQGS